MSTKLITLFSELEKQLAELNLNHTDNINYHQRAIQLIEDYLSQIETQLFNHQFESKKIEIQYFKHDYPKLFQLYFYHKSVVHIEQEKYSKCLTKENTLLFYQEHKHRFNNIQDEESSLLREANNTKTKRLFLRKHYRWRRKNISTCINETYVTNSITIAIGKRDAKINIIHYLEQQMSRLNEQKDNPKSSLKWSASKVLLMELIYALFLIGCINDGNIELHELVHKFEEIFNIDLGNHSSIIQNIKERKFNKTKFMDMLRDQLNNKLID